MNKEDATERRDEEDRKKIQAKRSRRVAKEDG